jgi:hypothetical protein
MASNNVSFYFLRSPYGGARKFNIHKKHIIDCYLSFGPKNCPLNAPLFGEIEVKGTQPACAARESAGKQLFLPCALQRVGGPVNMQGTFLGEILIAFATVTLLDGA